MRWLVTGGAGFIGFHLARRLLDDGEEVVVLDDLDDSYDPRLKQARLHELSGYDHLRFHRADLADAAAVDDAITTGGLPDVIVNLAAQAGVRHSLVAPDRSIHSNVVGFGVLLEACRRHQVGHLVYASSSSVYGETSTTPFDVDAPADHPVSLYAATKRADELMAHSYAHLFGIPATGLRFFTVYGPWGRPDMAYWLFTQALVEGRPLRVFGDGSALRDLTYIDDIVAAIVLVGRTPPAPQPHWQPGTRSLGSARAPWRLYNIGHGEQITIRALIELLESLTGRHADISWEPPQPGDLAVTHADTSALEAATGFRPSTTVADGMAAFVRWYETWRA